MAENPFKVGDTVVCVEDDGAAFGFLHKDTDYTIEEVVGSHVKIQRHGAPWNSERFKLKEAPVAAQPHFKVGDSVVCVDASGMPLLRQRDVYVVESCDKSQVRVAGVTAGLDPSRFKLMETAPVVETPEFKIGDTVVCVDAEGSLGGLVSGKEYRIRGVDPEFVWLECEPYMGWKNRRFKLKETPVESPEDWVEITDPNHVLRQGVDFVYQVPHHQWVAVVGLAYTKISDWKDCGGTYKGFRCLRKDHPSFQKPAEPVTNVHSGGPYVAVGQYQKLQAENTYLQGANRTLIKAGHDREDYVKALKDENTRAAYDLSAVRETLEKREAEISNLRSELASVRDNLKTLIEDHKALEKERDDLKSELEGVKEEKRLLSNANVVLSNNYADLSKARTEEASSLNQEIQSLRDRLVTEGVELSNISNDYRAHFRRLTAERDAVLKNLEDVKAELAQVNAHRDELLDQRWENGNSLDRWAEIALPAIIADELPGHNRSRMDWAFVATRAYECAAEMLKHQQASRRPEYS